MRNGDPYQKHLAFKINQRGFTAREALKRINKPKKTKHDTVGKGLYSHIGDMYSRFKK